VQRTAFLGIVKLSAQPSYLGYRFPLDIIRHAVRLYHRCCLSLRDVEDLLAERGVIVSHESVWPWRETR